MSLNLRLPERNAAATLGECKSIPRPSPDEPTAEAAKDGTQVGVRLVAAALIDRLVHHATMITLKGKSYRLRERGLDVTPAAQAPSLRDSA